MVAPGVDPPAPSTTVPSSVPVDLRDGWCRHTHDDDERGSETHGACQDRGFESLLPAHARRPRSRHHGKCDRQRTITAGHCSARDDADRTAKHRVAQPMTIGRQS
jgi:hypothetical protein